MHKKTVKYMFKGQEVYLDPNSKAYELFRNKQTSELNKLLDENFAKLPKQK